MSDTSFYRAFEDRYRGARDTIKDRLRAYDGFTGPLCGLPGGAVALDLGCGRGEWLELLGESGIDARGVDLDDGMLAACRERGLAARHGDALAALRAQPDASLALVSAFHLVEHIPFELVRELIAEALRALRPGGLLILETPNPENLTVGATSFYMDPSHLKPLPPNLLAFAVEHAGFARQRIVRLQEDKRLYSAASIALINVLEGVSADYSVVAQKAADGAVLAPFDDAFDAAWGITLGRLAQRYEQQRTVEHAEIHRNLARIDRHAADLAAAHEREHHHALDRARGHDDKLAELQREVTDLHRHVVLLYDRADQADAHIGALAAQAAATSAQALEMSAQAAAMAQRVADMTASTSWRVTAPMRRVTGVLYRLRNARREGRLGAAAKRRVRELVRRIGRAVLRRPALKRGARAVLRRIPALEARLHALMMDNSAAAAAQVMLEEEAGELSPRAARAWRQLKQEQARMGDADSH